MELYEAINKRRTVHDFKDIQIPQDVLERILETGMKGPSGNHLRDIHFVVIRDKSKIEEAVKLVDTHAETQLQSVKNNDAMLKTQKEMYLDSVPKQRQMLITPGTLILPFF